METNLTTSPGDPEETLSDEAVASTDAGTPSTPASTDEGGQTDTPEGTSQPTEEPEAVPADSTTAPTETEEEDTTEEGVSLKGMPEHWRSSYQTRIGERDAFKGELDTTKAKLGETEVELQALKDTPGYIKADTPLDQWDPSAGLTQMEQDAPEYHAKLVDTIVEKHLFSQLPDRLVAEYAKRQPLSEDKQQS